MEIKRSFAIYNHLQKFPIEAQQYIRRLMRDVLYRDKILNEFQLQDLVKNKAQEFQARDGVVYESLDDWDRRCREAKKQLTDFYFGANYSLDYLKMLIAEHAMEIEIVFNIDIPKVFDFAVNMEKADINILIKKMFSFEYLSPDDKAKVQNEIQELRIVLITRIISAQYEFVKVAHKFLTIEDLHHIYDRIIGAGRIGGKSAGMILACRILTTPEEGDPFDFAKYFRIPNSFYVGDDIFHNYLDFNGLLWARNQKFKETDVIEAEFPMIRERMQEGDFPAAALERLRRLLASMGRKPLIARSSSLLEDNFGLSFAGKYDSFFLANQGTEEENLQALSDAIKKIYAGVFSPNALAYRKKNEMIFRYESMSILIQEVEGKRYGKYFMPDMAGVIFSENPYCWSKRIRKEDGMMRLVYGLGTRAVERVGEDFPRLVALGQPTLRPEPKSDIERYSQKLIDVIDMERNELRTVSMRELMEEGSNPNQVHIFSTKKDGMIREAFTSLDLMEGKPVITFERLLSQGIFSRIIRAAAEKIRRHYGIELDIEFAGEVSSSGEVALTLLQCRPQSLRTEQQPAVLPDVHPEDIIFLSRSDIPNGQIDDISYLVYINPDEYARIDNIPDRYEIARLVGRINCRLEQHRAVLLGPGRWGSNNILLGVPVKYWEINNFKLLGEIARSRAGVTPEVSFGTHFFQDLVESGIFCVPIYPDAPNALFNESLLASSPNHLRSFVSPDLAEKFDRVVRVIRPEEGATFQIRMDGKQEKGLCYVKRGGTGIEV
jgi:hypothetical protein